MKNASHKVLTILKTQRSMRNSELQMEFSISLPKDRFSVSPALPGLWCATRRHWLSSRGCCCTKHEYHISISFRWLGSSGLKIIITPWESFIRAGQHVSNLEKTQKSERLTAVEKKYAFKFPQVFSPSQEHIKYFLNYNISNLASYISYSKYFDLSIMTVDPMTF